MNTQIFHFNNMTSKVIEGHKSASNFSVNPTLPLLDGPLLLPSPNCEDFSHSPSCSLSLSFSYSLSISLSTSLFCSMQTLIYNLLPCFNLNLRSYGQVFVLVLLTFKGECKCSDTSESKTISSELRSNYFQISHDIFAIQMENVGPNFATLNDMIIKNNKNIIHVFINNYK